MVVGCLDFYIREKLVNQHLVDLAQLGEKVRQIELLRVEKNKKCCKSSKKERSTLYYMYKSIHLSIIKNALNGPKWLDTKE